MHEQKKLRLVNKVEERTAHAYNSVKTSGRTRNAQRENNVLPITIQATIINGVFAWPPAAAHFPLNPVGLVRFFGRISLFLSLTACRLPTMFCSNPFLPCCVQLEMQMKSIFSLWPCLAHWCKWKINRKSLVRSLVGELFMNVYA